MTYCNAVQYCDYTTTGSTLATGNMQVTAAVIQMETETLKAWTGYSFVNRSIFDFFFPWGCCVMINIKITQSFISIILFIDLFFKEHI